MQSPTKTPSMKKHILLLLFICLVFACTHKLTSIQLKDNKSIEGVKIGMTLSDAITKINKKYYSEKTKVMVYEGENKEFEYMVYSDNTKKTILFSFNEGYANKTKGMVFRLAIKSSKYRTIEGVSVGMTVKELKEKTKIKSVDFNIDNGLFLQSGSFDGGYLMDMNTSKKYAGFDYLHPTINSLPGELKIKEIIIF